MLTCRNRLFLMFIPLLIAFAGLFLAIQDLKHPHIRYDQCRLIGRGLSIRAFKAGARLIYQRSGHPEDDIGFHCRQLGDIVINEAVPLPLKPTDSTQLTIKHFQFFPDRYSMSLSVFNPQGAEDTVKAHHK